MRSFPSLHTGSGEKSQQWLMRLIWIAAMFVMLGRGLQCLFKEVPLRALIWDEAWMGGIVRLFGWTWDSFITSLAVDHYIQIFGVWFGFFFLFAFLVTLGWRMVSHWLRQITWAGVWMLLVFIAFLYAKEKFFSLGQFFEYSLQFGTPFLLWISFRSKGLNKHFVLGVKILIALTFFCHGLYAVGYYPRPGHFVQMCIHFFGMSEDGAHTFLWIAGILDFIAAIFIFLPRPFVQIGLVYCIVWGFMTAAARVGANIYDNSFAETLFLYGPEFLFRVCHFLVPLGLYLHLRKNNVIPESDILKV